MERADGHTVTLTRQSTAAWRMTMISPCNHGVTIPGHDEAHQKIAGIAKQKMRVVESSIKFEKRELNGRD